MRLVTFKGAAGPRLGAMAGDRIVDLAATDSTLPATMKGLIQGGAATLAKAKQAVARSNAVAGSGPLLAPILDPGKIICVGLNYRAHAAEGGRPAPTEPVIFSKFTTTIIGPEAPIHLPPVSDEVDYEAELVVVIGREGKNIPLDHAMDFVFGYTVGHDVSARDWQNKKDGKQWLLGKSFDTFAPIGPAIVTKDEVPDPHDLPIKFRLNGQTMQDSNTGDMIFRIAELLRYVTQVFTVQPGDILFTGTPQGVGFARKPPVFLKPGDVCEVDIGSLGVLRNTVQKA